VIATDVAGQPWFVLPGEIGLLIHRPATRRRSPAALSGVPRRPSLGAARGPRANVERLYGEDGIVAETLAIYDRALEAAGSSA
jgi:hypothetical protein